MLVMKLQIVSDLHLEFWNSQPNYIGFTVAAGADALILAGDIHVGLKGFERFLTWPVPVIYIAGNHEYYGCRELGAMTREMTERCAGTNVRFVEKEAVEIPGFPNVRFLCSTLWTDYLLFGRERQTRAMHECGETLADHSRIRSHGRLFTPKDAMYRHFSSVDWLREQLEQPFDGKTVVVTHHGCHWNSVGTRWRHDLVSAGFASDLTPLVEQADLWIHGHTHDSHQYQVGKCRVVVNPRGYPVSQGGFENADFNPQLVVEV